jgi:D-alanyl-lipoteichoic acid acyltransferase DltB (MBOAT superfamily)
VIAGETTGSSHSGRDVVVGEAIFAALNIAVVALLVPLKSLALFFALCFAFVWLRSVLQGSSRTAVQAAGIVAVALLLLTFKSSELLFNDTVKRWVAMAVPGSSASFSAGLFAALGASYCFLRFVYALLDPSVTPWRFVRYYFFFPTFFSGPIIAPADFLCQRPSLARRNLVEGAARIMYGGVKFGLSTALQLGVPLTHITHFHLALKNDPWWSLWLGLFLCGIWLYLNFSAFPVRSDSVACRLRVPEGFRQPFSARHLNFFGAGASRWETAGHACSIRSHARCRSVSRHRRPCSPSVRRSRPCWCVGCGTRPAGHTSYGGRCTAPHLARTSSGGATRSRVSGTRCRKVAATPPRAGCSRMAT